MKKRLVLVGAGHAHLSTFLDLHKFVRQGHRPLVISPHPHYTYSGMGPGVLSGIYTPQQGRINVRSMVELRGADFLIGTVEGVDPDRGRLFLGDGKTVEYDLVSFNIGSHVPVDVFGRLEGPWIAAKPIDNFPVARQQLLSLLSRKPDPNLLVIGGGPAGVEISGNLSRLLKDQKVHGSITVVSGSRFLRIFSPRVRKLAAASLGRRGVRLIEGQRVTAVEGGTAILDDGRRLEADFTIIASGVQLSDLFRNSGLPVGPTGGLSVNRYLQCVDRPEIFGGGDCIDFADRPLTKIGVVAYRQNPTILKNLHSAVSGKPLRPFRPRPVHTLMFNLGDGTALFIRGGLSWTGRLAFHLKNRIDRRFMERHRAAESSL
jgi:NADH dehydrogenase FAD-containing subunit